MLVAESRSSGGNNSNITSNLSFLHIRKSIDEGIFQYKACKEIISKQSDISSQR